METLAKLIENVQTPTGGVFVLSILVLGMGILFLARLAKDSPLAGSALQVLAIILLVPAAMFLGVTHIIDAQAVTAILGGVAGYAFGRATH